MQINRLGLLDVAEFKPTPNKGGTIRPQLVVVHDTAGNIDNASSIAWLRNPQAKASAHFVIDRQGKVTQLAGCEVKTWHAGKSIFHGQQNCNDFSIGIEHVNPGKMLSGGRTAWGAVYSPKEYDIRQVTTPHHGDGYWMPYTEAQLAASLSLILAIRDRYEVKDIAPHWEISPGRKVDTNPLFPLASFRGRLEGREDSRLLVQAKPGAQFRLWPSFNASNRITKLDDDGWFEPIKSGVFEVQGTLDEYPDSLRVDDPVPQLWYKVVLRAAGQEDTEAWVWSGHVLEPRA